MMMIMINVTGGKCLFLNLHLFSFAYYSMPKPIMIMMMCNDLMCT